MLFQKRSGPQHLQDKVGGLQAIECILFSLILFGGIYLHKLKFEIPNIFLKEYALVRCGQKTYTMYLNSFAHQHSSTIHKPVQLIMQIFKSKYKK